MNICAARDQGPRSAGMARHLAPFSCRQRMAEIVRRRSFGAVLPLGRHASISGSSLIQCASDTIALSSFQEEQNARHHNQFKVKQALARLTGYRADAQQKWPTLTYLDLSQIKNEAQLVSKIGERDSLPPAQAQADVTAWMAGKSF